MIEGAVAARTLPDSCARAPGTSSANCRAAGSSPSSIDTLALATDGIAGDFAGELDATSPPRLVADRILARHAREIDDALVLTAQYAPVLHV